MPYDPSIFNISPYYDDYDPNNGFLRVLFKPGQAVQARELTQMQTILQNQVSKMGDHLFKDGSRIVGAPISVRNANFLGLRTGSNSPFYTFGSDDWKSLVGGTIYWGATAAAIISHVMPPETDDKLFVVVDYITGYGSSIPSTGITIGITTSASASYSPFVPMGSTHNGLCKLVVVGEGIFYVDGMFVRNTKQTFTPYSLVGTSYRDLTGTISGITFSALDKKVGFGIARNTTTYTENTSLLDPSFGSPNYRAPGADRYVLDLTLAQTGITTATNDFIELLRFEDGKVTKKVDKVIYGDISNSFAKRTYDESGSYIVNPFDVSIRSSTSPENLDVVIGPGKAYVLGYEAETKYPTIIGISKGRSTQGASASFIQNTGNVIGVSFDLGLYGTTAYANINTLNGGSAIVKFRNSSSVVIGEAKVHGMIPSITGLTGNRFKLYLFGLCGGSVIAGASTATIYNGASAGMTWGVCYPTSGTTFGTLGATGSDDTSLVYEITPTQGISAFTNLSFYGKAASKTSASGFSVSNAGSVTTYTLSPSNLDIGSVPGNISLVDGLGSTVITSGTARSIVSQYQLINQYGVIFSPENLNNTTESTITNVGVYNSSSSVVLSVTGAPIGFTAATAMRMIVPYKCTISSFDSSNCRIKTSTSYTITDGAYTFRTLPSGRIGITLPHWDVYSVSGITVSGENRLEDFELDEGQEESFYDYSSLVVKKSKEATSTPGGIAYSAGIGFTFSTNYKYFSHGGANFAPFVGHHSYSGISYEQIPLFTNSRTGRTVSLANCVDFRHSGPTADTIHAKPYGAYESLSASSAVWDNYLARIDRLGLKINPSDDSVDFSIVKGTPDPSPQSPPETENSITIATLLVPAFTHLPGSVVVNKNDVRRYTMSDINAVEKRIDSVETFTKLSVSELAMSAKTIKPAVDYYLASGGLTASLGSSSLSVEPVKTSIYTDDFYGHAGGDVADADHRCSVDYEFGELRSMFAHNSLTLGTLTHIGTTLSADGLLSLDYSSVSHITNDGYNKTISANPTGTVNWLGFSTVSKQYEPNFEIGVRPVIYNNNMLENDNWLASNANNTNGFGTQWNDWEYLWTGTQLRTDGSDDIQKRILESPKTNSLSSIPTIDSGNKRIRVSRNTTPTSEKVATFMSASRLIGRTRYRTSDNRIVDRTVVPYAPTNTIGITAYGLRPYGTGLNLYIDGTLAKSGISANAAGTVGVTFAFGLEAFLSGEKSIRIADNATPQNASQAADISFYCSGSVSQRSDGVYSTRNPEYRRQSVTSEGIIKNPFNREVSYDNITNTITNNQWIDPLCQTFFVDKKTNPEGIFASSITLYFESKDSILPVTVELRPTINGYPSPSVTIPFSRVTLFPSQVNLGLVGSTTTPNGTTFKFTSPVYLEPGEYAIAVNTNSKNYLLRANDSGVNLTNDGRNNNALVGTMYEPQSIGAAAQNLSTDISFSVDRCEFVVYGIGSATTSATALDVANCQVVKIFVPQIIPLRCNSSFILDYAGTPTTLQNNQNTYLPAVHTASKALKITLTPTTKSYISPVVDTGLFFGMGVEMICTTNTAGSPSSAYVSKAVTLPETLVSNGVFCVADVCCPYQSQVRAYVRWSDRGEGDLFSKSWTAMTALNGVGSPSVPFAISSSLSDTEFDFIPTQWAWFNSGANTRSYQIKLVYTTDFSGTNKTYSKLPAARNLRMASFRT